MHSSIYYSIRRLDWGPLPSVPQRYPQATVIGGVAKAAWTGTGGADARVKTAALLLP